MIVEDLTAQRRQIELKNKMEAELRESQGRLQELVLLRTSDLSKSNENLRAEIEERKRFQNKLFRALQKLETTLMSTVVALASMTEKKDPHTAGHQRRVSQLANAIATEMRLPKSKSAATKISAALHDIGKIYIPAEFLSKPGTITELEREIIREHPRVGYEILREVDFVWPVAEIVYQHHERMDGSGYPRSLRGEEILMEARILAVADVVEAMVSHRPYRQALSEEQALREIKSNSGTVYDDEVAAACLSVFGSGFAFS
jgi:putative nucleotidyltransferase with HDIG domain